jgi:cytochrome b
VLAGSFVFLWWSGKAGLFFWHKRAGFVVAGLVLFRLLWGVIGSDTARFAQFMRGPVATWRYLRGRSLPAVGHNPLGAWSVAVMLVLLAVQVGLGLFAIDMDGIEAGPLVVYVSLDEARRAADLHAIIFNILLVAVGLHVVAILGYFALGKDLIAPMITGRQSTTAAPPACVGGWRLAVSAMVGVVTTAILWWLETH